ncbi:MAG: hypothetical protein AUK03_16120 [Anaerolineae bacterium CG2_30_64_16]|nr:MAG: hypothetical protein AUK03_16120 [Anaerolineae bacterium CG2_30_64_16]
MVAKAYDSYRDLLLGGPHTDEEKRGLLAPVGFTDWRAADERLRRIGRTPAAHRILAELLPYLILALTNAANPDNALINFGRWAGGVPDQVERFRQLVADPRALELLITLFAGSQFLTEILLRNPDHFALLTERAEIATKYGLEAFLAAARGAVAAYYEADDGKAAASAALDRLRHFQHRELLRIGLGDLCGLLDLSAVTGQLSCLAESVVRVCLDLTADWLGVDPDGFAVLALGKLGGGELNYSSDIDLLFIAERDVNVYQRLGEQLIKALTQATGEGFLYRVDMRLRPWGQVGPLVSTLNGHLAYLRQYARLWEKQALLKARVVAGSARVGHTFLEWASSLQFSNSHETVRADVHAMKQRTEAQLRKRGRDWGEVKLGEGSIRDVEFVTQYLQLVHGGEHPEVRSGNTLDSLARLAEGRFLRADEYRVLVEGYVFLRTIEHYLQIFDYRQTNSLPGRESELTYLAQRLGFHESDAAAQFALRYQQHSAAIRAIYQRYLDAGAVKAPSDPPKPSVVIDVRKHLARLSPSYAATFGEIDIRSHATLAERLSADNPVEIAVTDLGDAHWRVTIVGYDYPGELSLICGLLFVHGFSIVDGHVYTYEPSPPPDVPQTGAPRDRQQAQPAAQNGRRKIVDVFTVRAVRGEISADLWSRYADDLRGLLRLLEAGQLREAQGELATRVALALRDLPGTTPTLHPIELEIDNDASDRYTMLRIDTPDTIGFLYEFTNALALNGIYISQVAVASVGNRVQDVLYVTDRHGQKITSADKLRELRAATVLVKHFTHLLPQSPDPEAALLHFHEYLGQLFRNPAWPAELASLERPEVLNALARLLGVSEFLWDDFLRMQYSNLFPVVRDLEALATPKSQAQLAAELDAALPATALPGAVGEEEAERSARRAALNAFKDREMFRIDMRYIQGHITDFRQFSRELTDLAEVVIGAAYRICDAELRGQHGDPRREDGLFGAALRPAQDAAQDRQSSTLSICALGKCGGRELGFASDIELMFIYTGGGVTTGPEIISTPEYFEKLVIEITRAIRARREGIFEIDLQLRPYGSAGSLAVSLASFQRYFGPGGAAWDYERQALVKLRPIAGDPGLGSQVLALRDAFVYSGTPFDVSAMQAMRERQVRHLVTAGSLNAKFSLGGLVDVEYLVQGLQITHGRANPALRVTNTAEAIVALAEAGILSPEDHDTLRAAHAFLWQLVEALRVVRGNARDLTVPSAGSEEFAFLARRLGYGHDLVRLESDMGAHTAAVQLLHGRLLHA